VGAPFNFLPPGAADLVTPLLLDQKILVYASVVQNVVVTFAGVTIC